MILASKDRKRIAIGIVFGFACFADSNLTHTKSFTFVHIGFLPTYGEAMRWLDGDKYITPTRIIKSGEIGNV